MASPYLNQQHFDNINQYISNGSQVHVLGYKQLIQSADEALQQEPFSVRAATHSPYLLADAVYIPGQDGVVNPERNQKAFDFMRTMSEHTLTLAYAYRLSKESTYAEKALDFIHAWCINENTRMFATGQVEGPASPGMTHGGNVGMMMTLPLFFTACYLMDDYPGWGLTAHAAVRRWIKDMLDPQRHIMFFAGYEMYNNWEDARLRYLATGALALDDLELLQYVFDRWKTIIPIKMEDNGALPRECERTRSMTYTIAALGMAVDVAEIAKAFAVDLYNYTHNGKSIKLAIDYASRHLLDMNTWPHQMINPIEEEIKKTKHFGFWELAYREWENPRYLDIINHYEKRPLIREHVSLIFGKP